MSEEKKATKSKSNLIIIILLIVILVGGGAGAYMIFFNKSSSTPKVVHPLADEVTFSLTEFTVNLADKDGTRFIKTTISVGYKKNTKLTAELTANLSIVRDAVNTVLRSKTAAQLNVKGTLDMKKELMNAINPLLQNGQIDNVYYDSIIVQ